MSIDSYLILSFTIYKNNQGSYYNILDLDVFKMTNILFLWKMMKSALFANLTEIFINGIKKMN